MALTDKLTNIANAIRGKTGGSDLLTLDGMATAISEIQTGGGGEAVVEKEVNFYDYDGTLLHSYTIEEAQALTELPELPAREGLICQEWNYDLETIKAYNRPVNVGATYITDDGKTRIYIKLEEGRTSPMLGVCPNGTVEVDWGDGTEHDILTGTDITVVQWTPTHNYASAGEYVIKLTVTGAMGFFANGSNNAHAGILRYSSSSDTRNSLYRNAVQKIEIGNNVTSISNNAFQNCYSLSTIVIPKSVTSIGNFAFAFCYSLETAVIPKGVTSISLELFRGCYSLTNVSIPDGVTSIGLRAFSSCYSLSNIVIPESVTSIGGAFGDCNSLKTVLIPDSVTSIDGSIFAACRSLSSIVILNGITSIKDNSFNNCNSLKTILIPESVTSIENYAFATCYSLSSIVIPNGVTSIEANAFLNCYGMKFYDFSNHTSVPTLSNTNAFQGISADCEIRVPAALYDEWIAATNWATYADYIVRV